MIHLFNCPDNALIMVTQYILNTSAEADGLIRNTQISSIRHNARVLCPDTIHVFCVQTQFTCVVSRHDSRVLCADMIHLFNCSDNELIMVTQYILNTSAETDGLIRSTQISSISS